jgi:RNAse (barnase) inhibitor barstar
VRNQVLVTEPIHRLPPGDVEGAIADLERLGFRVFRLDGAKIDDQRSFHEEVAEAFEFSDYYGRNWDAFEECFSEVEMPSRVAIVWTRADVLASRDLKAFAEAVCLFFEHSQERVKMGVQLEIFLGDGRQFETGTPRSAAAISAAAAARILDGVDELLFNSGELRLALEAQATKMRDAVEAEPEGPTPMSGRRRLPITSPSPARSCRRMTCGGSRKDVKVDVSWNRSRYFSGPYSDLARNFPGYRVVFHVPFEGDAGVFSLRPSSFTFNRCEDAPRTAISS